MERLYSVLYRIMKLLYTPVFRSLLDVLLEVSSEMEILE